MTRSPWDADTVMAMRRLSASVTPSLKSTSDTNTGNGASVSSTAAKVAGATMTGASFWATTVTATDAPAARGPPDPDDPKSDTDTDTDAAPLKWASGVYVMRDTANAMAAVDPSTVTLDGVVSSVCTTRNPAWECSRTAPCVAVTTERRTPAVPPSGTSSASMSETVNPVTTREPPSRMDNPAAAAAAGVSSTAGASLTAATCTSAMTTACFWPPAPEPPLSLAVTVTRSGAANSEFQSGAGTYTSVVNVAWTSANGPSTDTEWPSAAAVTLDQCENASSVTAPTAADTVTLTSPSPKSTSVTVVPAPRSSAVSSSVNSAAPGAKPANVTTGASFSGVTATDTCNWAVAAAALNASDGS